MTKVAVIIGSTRPGRLAPQVAEWFMERTKNNTDVEFELVDIADYNLPLLDEDQPAKVSLPHTVKWSKKISSFDGYVFVTAEHNHAFPASLKNAIDYLNQEWSHKPVGYVGYGWAGGYRAIESLRTIAAQFSQYDLREEVNVFIDGSGVHKATDNDIFHADALVKSIAFWANEFVPIRKKL